MTEVEQSGKRPIGVQWQIDKLCAEFERALNTKTSPRIEDYLARLAMELRGFALHQLLALELDVLAKQGVEVDRDDYLQRFSDYSHVVHDALKLHMAKPLSAAPAPVTTTPSWNRNSETPNWVKGPQNVKDPIPKQIGRYQLHGVLGEGGYGRVYHAHDPHLNREVALKVPNRSLFDHGTMVKSFINEARSAAMVKHPGIIAIYDVQQEGQQPYIVQECIEGPDLGKWAKRERPPHETVVALLVEIADAVGFAHRQGLIHRDLKPSNILMDAEGHAHVADFGLALHESAQPGRRGEIAGTPQYMSPEQVRGETHRLDGRTDLWSLGVILYELLSGKRPFTGKTQHELFAEIETRDPLPVRQRDPTISQELERICLKCLEKRRSDRYSSTADLIDDLRFWLGEQTRVEKLEQHSALTPPREKDFDSSIPRIVPKGLCSFDEADADFFLELLPGPHDRDGLPQSIRFWKTRIEETDPDNTFSVGLIYGPSGCGKTSLVKAGLLPRLAKHVVPVYIQATPNDTETRLLSRLSKRIPGIPPGQTLPNVMRELRERSGRKKVLIVLDQFEQWLHAQDVEESTQLAAALRHCDGQFLQSLVMVRDDFWIASTRFMRCLDIRLVEGENSNAVDLFPIRHAQHVLTKFGQAFGTITDSRQPSAVQKRFIAKAIDGLAQGGKVISVRLALFAEMMKGKPWTPEALRDVGGAEGVGAAFLEATFSASTAPPEHRLRQKEARAVLAALLPPSNVDIKGHARSYQDLLKASGYLQRPSEFAELLRILDNELRLIAPVDPEGVEGENESSHEKTKGERFYQLTHDYLAPSLRDWLTQKQRETRRGRAELQLEERSSLWNSKPEKRHLPSFWETVNIVRLSPARNWTQPQRRMMAQAKRVYGLRAGFGCVLILALLAGAIVIHRRSVEFQMRTKARNLVDQLFVARIEEAPGIINSLDEISEKSRPLLKAAADNPMKAQTHRLRATLALTQGPGDRASRLMNYALSSDLPTLTIIRDRVAPFADRLADGLWEAARGESSTPSSRLRAAALLAIADPSSDAWEEIASAIVNALLAENTLDLDAWVELLRPAAFALTPKLRDRFFDASRTSSEQGMAARALARYAEAQLLCELLLQTESDHFSTLFAGASQRREGVIRRFRETIRQGVPSSADNRIDKARRIRNAAVTLARLGRMNDIMPLLSASSNPTARTLLILGMREFGVPPELLIEAFGEYDDPVARQAVLLAIGRYRRQQLPTKMEEQLLSLLKGLLRDGQHPSERSAAEWLWRRWHGEENIPNLNPQPGYAANASGAMRGDRRWWVTSQGHIMSVVRGPIHFTIGSPESEQGHQPGESLMNRMIPYSFAVSAHEVTMEQFQRFRPGATFALDVADNPQCPANRVSVVDAMQYCRWLSKQEGVTEVQMVYRSQTEIQPTDAFLPEERLTRTGFRLLTEAEWECVCRAGSTTPWFCGDIEQALLEFAWFAPNARARLHSVGSLMPNSWGLFDIVGNVAEWCHSPKTHKVLQLRGGAYSDAANRLRSAYRHPLSNTGYSFTGFRIARTVAFGQ